jgi:hypothetical protein
MAEFSSQPGVPDIPHPREADCSGTPAFRVNNPEAFQDAANRLWKKVGPTIRRALIDEAIKKHGPEDMLKLNSYIDSRLLHICMNDGLDPIQQAAFDDVLAMLNTNSSGLPPAQRSPVEG